MKTAALKMWAVEDQNGALKMFTLCESRDRARSFITYANWKKHRAVRVEVRKIP